MLLRCLPLALLLAACSGGGPATDKNSTVEEASDADDDGIFGDDDCNDNDASVYPGAEERCDGIDNNCDGAVDEGVLTTWYPDEDEDGFGDPTGGEEACAPPAGTVANADDCDDSDAAVLPGATDDCDGVDSDCDGTVDEDGLVDWFPDADDDGFGDPSAPTAACEAPDGMVADHTDCDDTFDRSYPDAPELCDERDNNCDGFVDEGVTTVYYEDRDEDGYGSLEAPTEACATPIGYADLGGDCDDDDPAYHPDAPEADCTDPHDYNCDGSVGYADADLDGWAACADCDDSDPTASPDGHEVCGGGDEDCDGARDDADPDVDLSTGATFYADGDGDSYGDSALTACALPAGYAAVDGDCLDTDAAIHPGAVEVCDGSDNDCDALIDDADPSLDPASRADWYTDGDGDGHGDPAHTTAACLAPAGTVAAADDCVDTDAAIHPGALEVCDGTDNDCDALTDDADPSLDPASRADWYADVDGDGHGDPASTTAACLAPAGTVASADDCVDANNAIYPGAAEVCDGLDNDCDLLTDDADPGIDTSTGLSFYVDADGDGDGNPRSTVWACAPDAGRVTNSDDCDDSDPAQGPCQSCLDILDGGLSTGDGVYSFDPCGTGSPSDYYCDMTHSGGGWTVAGWQGASAKTFLGNSDWGTVGGSAWSTDLSCVAYDEIAVFNQTYGQFYTQSYTAATWTATSGNQAIGPVGSAFKQGTYGPSASLIVMGCVGYAYSGTLGLPYACDNDGQRGQKGHIADYAGEFCSGGRLDYTWAWTDGSTCAYRGTAYTWGFAIR